MNRMVGMALLLTAAGGLVAHEWLLPEGKWIAFQDAETQFPARIFSGAPAAEIAAAAPEGEIPGSVNVFLLEREGEKILFDAGNGGTKGLLAERLREAGIAAAEIDAVLLTHMHFDHIGGLVDAAGKAVFTGAEIHVAQAERDYWASPAAGERGVRAMAVLAAYGDRVRLFEPDREVLPGIFSREASGHTPGHTVFETDSVLVIGDLLHGGALQFANPVICASFDMNHARAVASRLKFFGLASGNGKYAAAMHLPYPGVGTIAEEPKESARYRFLPAE